MASLPPGENKGADASEIDGVPPGKVYICTACPCAECSNHDEFTENRKHNKYFHPDILTDESPSTGWYTIWCVVMQLTSIVRTKLAN